MQESGLVEIIPWGQCPGLYHPESPQGAPLGVAAAAYGLMSGILPPS